MKDQHRHFRAGLALAALTLALAAHGAAQTNDAGAAASPAQWRTPWGHPDLQGTWSSDDVRGIPLQRPEEFGTRSELTDEEFVERQRDNDAQVARLREGGSAFLAERGVRSFRPTSLVVDPPNGRIPPLTASAQQRADKQNARHRSRPSSWEDRSLYDRCLTRGVVGSILPVIYGNGLEIHQTPNDVVIRYEMIHEPDYKVLPYECHEGNRALANILSAARAEDRAIAEARAKGLPEPMFETNGDVL